MPSYLFPSPNVQSNFDNIVIYPNPYIPNDGNTSTGTPYVGNDDGSGIYINGLMSNSKILLYTIDGKLVFETITPAGIGFYQWNVKNNSGCELASGIYILYVNNASNQATKKISIIK